MMYLRAGIRTPIRFVSAGQFVSDKPWIHSRRCLDSFELMIGITGTLFMEQDGERYQLTPSSLLLLLPAHIHAGYQISEQPVSFFWCHFLCEDTHEILNESMAEKEISSLINATPVANAPNFCLLPTFSNPPDIDKINIIFNQLLHVANADYYSGLAADYWLTCLLIELSQQTVNNHQSHLSRSRRKLNKILEWTRIHALGTITVSEIATKFNYNPDYLSRLFKHEVGMGPHEYIQKVKLSKAKELLYQTEQSVKDIAYAVGFEDEKHFMKLFKQYEKVTPTEYRKSYYQSHLNNR